MADATSSSFETECYTCRATFNAMDATWCSCLFKERTLTCPSCLTCFCKAPQRFKSSFWEAAPPELWKRKAAERQAADGIARNPQLHEVVRPLVLVVEDEKEIQAVAAKVIESLGFGFALAQNGREGLELVRRYRPELVLSDALMPKLDGREMCKIIKENPDYAGIKVIIMTSLYTSGKYRAEGFKEFLADDYVSKPLDFQDLRALLTKHLG